MIQRIQTLYLLLTTLFSVLFLGGEIIRFTDRAGDLLYINLRGLNRIDEAGAAVSLSDFLPLTILLILLPVMAVITIFLFRNRKMQMKVTAVLIFVAALLIIVLAIYVYLVSGNYDAEMKFGINMVLPVLALACSFLAWRGIRRDEDLVRSYDRLR